MKSLITLLVALSFLAVDLPSLWACEGKQDASVKASSGKSGVSVAGHEADPRRQKKLKKRTGQGGRR